MAPFSFKAVFPFPAMLSIDLGFVYFLHNDPFDLLPVTLSGFFRMKPANRMYLDTTAPLELASTRPYLTPRRGR